MVKLYSTTILGFAFTLVVVHVAAIPLHHGTTHQRRAVDVTALIHNEGRPDPAPVAKPPLSDRAVNPEGWVPYLHDPSETAQPSNDKRSVDEGAHALYQHDTRSVVETRYYDRERVPLPRPVPQQQGGGSSESNGSGRKRESDPIRDNLNRKPVDVVPIVGRAVDPETFDGEGRQPVDMALMMERDVDSTVLDNTNEKPVDVVHIVGRAVDPTVSDNIHGKPVDVVPIVGRDDTEDLVGENLSRKPVDVVPIVGRAVDVGAFTQSSRICGPDALKYDPTEELCDDQGAIQPLNSVPSSSSPERQMSLKADKRSAFPEPQTDKLTCNGQRYMPSEQTCTANGDLINVPQTPHNSAAPPPTDNSTTNPTKRAISQCGSALGSITFDRATEYCDPITQQVSPLTVGGPAVRDGKPTLVPRAARESATKRQTAICTDPDGYNRAEYDPNTQCCIEPLGIVRSGDDCDYGSNQAYRALERKEDLVPDLTSEGTQKNAGGKRDSIVRPAKIPFWEYWYDDTYDSDVDGDSD